MKRQIFIALIVFVSVFISGCTVMDRITDRTVARVGLTKLSVRQFNEKTRGYNKAQKEIFVNSWVEHQLWRKQAKRKTHLDSRDRLKIKKLKDEIRITKYKKDIKSDLRVSENDILDYYKANSSLYRLKERAYFLEIFSFLKKNRALEAMEKLKSSNNAVSGSFARLHRDSECHPKLLDAIRKSSVGSYHGPLNINGRYYIARIIEKYSPNDLIRLEHVSDDIREKCLIEKYIKTHDKKLNELKENTNVKIYQIPS